MVFCAAPLFDTAKNTKYHGYSVDDAVQSMAPKSVSPKKFNLGLSLSGVTFTLKDPKKTSPGAPAIGPGKEGCQEKGAMAYFEAKKLSNNLQIADADSRQDHFNREITQEPVMDPIGKCMYMVVNNNQWVGFDTPETFALKIEYLKKLGFGGVSIWSMDSDSANHELTTSIHKSLTSNFVEGESVPGGNSEEPLSDADSKDKSKSKDSKDSKDLKDPKKTVSSAACSMYLAGFAAKLMTLAAAGIFFLA